MKTKRFFLIIVGSLCISILLVIGAVVGGDLLFKAQAKKLNDLKVQSKVVEAQETALVQAKKDIQQYSSLNDIAKSVVPQDKDQAKTVREIFAIAADSGIDLQSVTFPTSTLGQIVAPTAPTSSGTTTGEAPAAKPKTPPLSQTTAVEGIPGVFALPISIASNSKPVPYRTFLNFLAKLESSRRTAHVEKIAITPTVDTHGVSVVTFQLTLNAYVKP